MINNYIYVSAKDALSLIHNGMRVYVHGGACTPQFLLQALAEEKDRLNNVDLVSITLKGDIEIAKQAYEDNFHFNSLFVSTPIRQAVTEGRADFVPIFLSDIPDLFRAY